MITSLIANAAVPAWDRALVMLIQDAALGLSRAAPEKTVEVAAAGEEVYRAIVAEGQQELDAILDRLAQVGFVIHVCPERLRAVLPELAAAALKK